jgi:hypothetical protein
VKIASILDDRFLIKRRTYDEYVSREMSYLKAAKLIGLTIPPNVLARADRVIK